MPASSEGLLNRRLRLSVCALAALCLAGSIMRAPAAEAREQRNDKCPPASVGGKAIGEITVGDVTVPVKRVRFRGGTLTPPPSARVAGLSRAHAPLDAEAGTTVLTWHVRYGKRCPGALNDLVTMPLGSTFTVTDGSGRTTEYRITRRAKVPKGFYPVAWFSQAGPRRLALFTCGNLRKGAFRSTVAIFAKPT